MLLLIDLCASRPHTSLRTRARAQTISSSLCAYSASARTTGRTRQLAQTTRGAAWCARTRRALEAVRASAGRSQSATSPTRKRSRTHCARSASRVQATRPRARTAILRCTRPAATNISFVGHAFTAILVGMTMVANVTLFSIVRLVSWLSILVHWSLWEALIVTVQFVPLLWPLLMTLRCFSLRVLNTQYSGGFYTTCKFYCTRMHTKNFQQF